MTFVSLIFGFCAGVVPYGPNQTLLFGYMVEGDCIPHLELTGTNLKEPQTLPDKHTLLWEWLDDGSAEVTIDDQKFVIPKFEEA